MSKILRLLCALSMISFGAAPTTFSRTIATKSGKLTLDLVNKSVRGPRFEILVQDSTGALSKYVPDTATLTCVGTVREHPDAMVAGLVGKTDGKFRGKIYFDVTPW